MLKNAAIFQYKTGIGYQLHAVSSEQPNMCLF